MFDTFQAEGFHHDGHWSGDADGVRDLNLARGDLAATMFSGDVARHVRADRSTWSLPERAAAVGQEPPRCP